MFLIDLPEPWCDLLFLKCTRSRLMPCLEWKEMEKRKLPVQQTDCEMYSLGWCDSNFDSRWWCYLTKLVSLQTVTSLEEMGCWEQTLEFIATYSTDTKALLLICQNVRYSCCKLKAAFTESHLSSFHTMMDCLPKTGN